MAKKRLPKTVFVRRNDVLDDPFLECEEDPSLLAEPGSTTVAGIYELKETVTLVNTTEIIS